MQFTTSTPRHLRSHLRRLVVAQALPLFVVGPKITGRPGYWYATIYGGCLHAITKRPVITRDEGRGPEAVRRFGRKDSEYRVRGGSYVQAQIIEGGKKVAPKWSIRTGCRIEERKAA